MPVGCGGGHHGPGGWVGGRTLVWPGRGVLLICPFNDLTKVASLLWHNMLCHWWHLFIYIYIEKLFWNKKLCISLTFKWKITLPGTFPYKEVSLGKASFSCKMPLKIAPQKLNFWMPKDIWKSYNRNVGTYVLARFRIVTHGYAASFSRKVTLCETNNIFCSQEYQVWHKNDNRFWKYVKNNVQVTLDSFRNFAYVSSYLRLNSLSWKRDYLISRKVQTPQTSLRPFQKGLIKYY